MKLVLLHICCGVCCLHSIEVLRRQNYAVIGFFYNPNIHPEQEYFRRLAACRSACQKLDAELIVPAYDPDPWEKACGERTEDPEGGTRCMACYELRLAATRDACVGRGYDHFSTTLTISPHKKSRQIHSIGTRLDPERFLALDFKKQDGFKKTMAAAKEHGLYRQAYCGCKFSGAPR